MNGGRRVVAEASPPIERLRSEDDHEEEYIRPPPLQVLRFEGKVIWHEIDSADEDEDDEDIMQGRESYIMETTYYASQAEKAARGALWSGKAVDQTNAPSAVEAQTRIKPKKGQWLVLISDEDSPEEICEICLEKVNHRASWCPYLTYVPNGKPIGPRAAVVCKCCGIVDGHPSKDWIGYAIFR